MLPGRGGEAAACENGRRARCSRRAAPARHRCPRRVRPLTLLPPPPASAALASTWLTPAATSHWRRGACRAIGVLQEQFTELQNVLLSELRAAVGAVEAKEHAAVRPIEAEMVRDACVPT